MLDYIDSQRSNPNSEYYGFDLGQVVLGKDYNAKKQAEQIYVKYNPKTAAEKMDAILKEIPEPEKRYDVLSRCFGINDLKEYYYENRDKIDPEKASYIHATSRYDSFFFYVTMISNMTQKCI
jgi:hypothetical protein